MASTLNQHEIIMSEELVEAGRVIEGLLKARKILRMYPDTNPIYIKNLKDISDKFSDYFSSSDNLVLRFARNDIYVDSESVYNNSEKKDNLALLFFKDGIRELTFHKDISDEELEGFLKIISLEFDRETIEDDIVTLLWQKDFKHIHYIADDSFLTENEDDEASVISGLQRTTTDPVDLKKAYEDSLNEEDSATSVPIIPLTAEDFKLLLTTIEKDREEKLDKFFSMLFELFYDAERSVEYEDIVLFFMKTIEFSLGNSKFLIITNVLERMKKIISDENTDTEMKRSAIRVLLFVSGSKMINLIGTILASERKIDKNVFQNFVCLLDKNAISPFINLLGELQGIHARRMVIDALVSLGPKDMPPLVKGLNHSQWFVIRNIIYILRQIGDRSVIKHIAKAAKHEDVRVRREVLRTLGELGNDSVLDTLKECLQDQDTKIRIASLSALGHVASPSAKKVVMEQISHSAFNERKLEEKKEFFKTLSQWNEKDVYDFCLQIITKKIFWKRSQQYETKACAAESLGILGNRNALPVLIKCKTSGSRVLQESSDTAIKRIERGK
jgi:HEAT repeat protein